MKKSKKFLFASLLAIPMIALVGCVPPNSYTINALPSDSNLGSILGAKNDISAYEGTSLNLSVKELKPQTNPFICWVKDYKTVVSSEKTLNLKYNENTQGAYTAIFEEQDLTKMMYSSFSSANITTSNFAGVKYTLSYARTAFGSSNYIVMNEGSLVPSETLNTSNTDVLYFGGLGENFEYKIKIALTFLQANGSETTYTVDFSNFVSRSAFDDNGQVTLSGTIPNLPSSADDTNSYINLTFTKLKSSLYSTSTVTIAN